MHPPYSQTLGSAQTPSEAALTPAGTAAGPELAEEGGRDPPLAVGVGLRPERVGVNPVLPRMTPNMVRHATGRRLVTLQIVHHGQVPFPGGGADQSGPEQRNLGFRSQVAGRYNGRYPRDSLDVYETILPEPASGDTADFGADGFFVAMGYGV